VPSLEARRFLWVVVSSDISETSPEPPVAFIFLNAGSRKGGTPRGLLEPPGENTPVRFLKSR
jgi:hypothetical protein